MYSPTDVFEEDVEAGRCAMMVDKGVERSGRVELSKARRVVLSNAARGGRCCHDGQLWKNKTRRRNDSKKWDGRSTAFDVRKVRLAFDSAISDSFSGADRICNVICTSVRGCMCVRITFRNVEWISVSRCLSRGPNNIYKYEIHL